MSNQSIKIRLVLLVAGVTFSTFSSATSFQTDLSTSKTFAVTATDAPLMVGSYGNQNYLASNPECPLILGNHSYASQEFVTQTTNSHRLETVLPNDNNVDTFIALYSPSFDPNNPTQNLVSCDDDGGSSWPLSAITTSLSAGTPYTVVVTTWNANPVDGTINWQITPDITLSNGLPAPRQIPTIGLFGAGVLSLLLAGAVRRRLKYRA